VDLPASILTLRKKNAKFTTRKRGGGGGDVEGSPQANDPREAAEVSLHEVIARRRRRRPGGLLAGDEEQVVAKDHAQVLVPDARHIQPNFDRSGCFDDVQRRSAFLRVSARLGRHPGRQLGEQPAEVVSQLNGVA
jgi:hypothetical protein